MVETVVEEHPSSAQLTPGSTYGRICPTKSAHFLHLDNKYDSFIKEKKPLQCQEVVTSFYAFIDCKNRINH